MSVALVAIVKDEDPYLAEFLAHYALLGFTRVFLYDNSDSNVLAWIANDFISVVWMPGKQKQYPAYMHFLQTFAKDFTWAAFFDADEFLVLKQHACVLDFLRDHCPHGAVGINWAMYGPCGHFEYTPVPVTQRFQYRAAEIDRHIKSIVKLADVRAFNNAHFFVCEHGTRDTSGNAIESPWNDHRTNDVAQLNHYLIKSRNEYHRRIRRGRADIAEIRDMSLFVQYESAPTVHDPLLLEN